MTGSESSLVSPRSDAPLPVAIVGMHRSGTSMVAKLLHQAGLNLGPEASLMPAAPENPEGFYEHLEFVQLNDEVLNEAGAGWDCPPPETVHWDDAAFDPLRERARSLAAPLAESPPWGWKDPRTSITLPFWQSALGPMRTIVVVRNPLEVITSLHRRNGFTIALGLTLWRIYAERVLRDTTASDRLVTHFDAYFLEPGRELDRIAPFIGLEKPDVSVLESTAVAGLRHHRRTLRDLEEHGFPPDLIRLYRDLCREASWWEGDQVLELDQPQPRAPRNESIARGDGRVDLIRVENESLRRNIADFTRAFSDRESRVSELESALRMHEAARSDLEGFLRERDGRLRERNAVLQIRDATIAALEQQTREREAALAQAQLEAETLRERVAELQRAATISSLHERDLREMLTGLQAVQMQRDAEIMGTLGSVLSRHAPGAPASIYHRRLVAQIRQLVDVHLPATARVLVATYGDDAMLELGERRTETFPRATSPISADYTDVSDQEAMAQLDNLRNDGAEYLVVPSPAFPWLASHPALESHLDERHTLVARERGIIAIYALRPTQGQIPA